MEAETRTFGPFLDVPRDAVKPTGFVCKYCRKPVEKFAQVVPYLVSRVFFHACRCGATVTFEDESQPDNSRIWKINVRLMRKARASVLIFNGNKPIPPQFHGIN
jgi:hypothetical protein